MKRLLIAALVFGCLAAGLAEPNTVSAETRKMHVSAASGLTTVPLYTSKTRDKVLRQVPAQTINGTFDVDASSSSAISIRLGGETVWLDTFDVVVSDPARAKQECIVLSKGLKQDQSNMGLDNACSKK